MVELEDIFYIPVRDKYLVYAPLKRVVALVNLKALRQIKEQLQTDSPALGEVESLLERLRLQGEPIPFPGQVHWMILYSWELSLHVGVISPAVIVILLLPSKPVRLWIYKWSRMEWMLI